jgi:hypothetical protein
MPSRLSPLWWDRINLTSDYVWSERLALDDSGLIQLLGRSNRESVSE